MEYDDGIVVFNTPEKIFGVRCLVLRSVLKMEMRGIQFKSRRTAYSVIKEEFDLHGTRESVLEQFTNLLIDRGILRGEHKSA